MAKKSKTMTMEEFIMTFESPKKRKKKTLVEKVLTERNLVVAPIEPLTAPIVNETERGIVRIEGEVTPEKLQLARQFDAIFTQVTGEILDLASYTPNENVREFVRKSGLTQEQTQNMLKAPPWTVFTVAGESLMKTPDNKLETVKNYCYRLEQAVINVARIKDSEIQAKNKDLDYANEAYGKLLKRQTLLEKDNKDFKNRLIKTQNKLESVPFINTRMHLGFLGEKTLLFFKTAFSKLKTLFISLLSEESKNGKKEESTATTSNEVI